LKKLFNIFKTFNTVEANKRTTEDFNYVIMEIIEDVIKKRKEVHQRYEKLIQMVWLSTRPMQCKTYLAKYLLGRLLRESHEIFCRGQTLATRLCPNCNNYQEAIGKVYLKYSKNTH